MFVQEYILLFFLSFCAAALAIRFLRGLALRLDITDRPSARKIHASPVPYLGGLAFHFSMACGYGYAVLLAPHLFGGAEAFRQFNILFCVAAGFQLLGVLDDIYHLSAWKKLLFETVLSLILVRMGFSISHITNPFGGAVAVGWLGDVLSVLWILTIVNAINFIDGLDGLAGGVVFFAALANYLIALHPWQNFICFISLILMGTTLAFLPYNFAKNKIFMGDGGSLYLGVFLAGSSLASNVKGATVMSLSLPLVILSIPLLDTFLTVIRRGKAGMHLFTADREHIHHRILRLGFSDRQAVLFLYGLCFLFAMSAVLASKLPDRYTLVFILVFLAGVAWGLTVFRALENRLLRQQESPARKGEEQS